MIAFKCCQVGMWVGNLLVANRLGRLPFLRALGVTRADVARAVMEGVALTLAEARDCLAAAGAAVERAGLIGGGAKSALWTRMIAATTGFAIVRMRGGETGPALGATRLARMAATGEPVETVCNRPEIADVTMPDPKLAAAFARQRERFRALYAAVKAEFRR